MDKMTVVEVNAQTGVAVKETYAIVHTKKGEKVGTGYLFMSNKYPKEKDFKQELNPVDGDTVDIYALPHIIIENVEQKLKSVQDLVEWLEEATAIQVDDNWICYVAIHDECEEDDNVIANLSVDDYSLELLESSFESHCFEGHVLNISNEHGEIIKLKRLMPE